MSSKLIIALDFNEESETLSFIDSIDPSSCALKVGSELYTRFGPNMVRTIINRNFKVFLDLKFHDIPNQVTGSCKAAADLGVWMVNVHALGGLRMMESAQTALLSYGENKPLLIAVTVLTSSTEAEYQNLGFSGSLEQGVLRLAGLAKQAGLEGVVCSAHEASLIKKNYGSDFVAVTPGIRLKSDDSHDQSRIVAPKDAIAAGSDYLVVGRSITQSKHPAAVIQSILDDCWT